MIGLAKALANHLKHATTYFNQIAAPATATCVDATVGLNENIPNMYTKTEVYTLLGLKANLERLH